MFQFNAVLFSSLYLLITSWRMPGNHSQLLLKSVVETSGP